MSYRGFSLVELVVVIAIMGILMAIAVPNYNQWQRKNNVERQTRELLTELNVARLDSIYRKTRHSIVLNPNNYIMKRYSSPNESATAGGTTVLTKNVQYPITKLIGSFAAEHIVFDTRGFVEMGLDPATGLLNIKIDSLGSDAAWDCIVVSEGRTNVGKVDSNVCVQK